MKDIIMSIFKTSEERLKNPFIGTFILSFIALNWKPISVFLLSNQKIEERVIYVTDNYSNIFNILLYPLLISIFYLVVIPYIMWLFENLTFKSFKERNQNLYKNKLIDIDGKKIVAQSEIELENLKADFKEKADLNRQVDFLKEKLSEKDINIKKLEENVNELSSINNDLKKDVNGKERSINELYEKLEDSEIRTKNYYEEYANTPKNTIVDFVSILNRINKAEKSNENYIYIDRFIALGLLQMSKNENLSNNKKIEYIEITDKGLFFIKKAFNDKLI
jgi:hypothetical protein